jgi:hypothetical protein
MDTDQIEVTLISGGVNRILRVAGRIMAADHCAAQAG